MDWGYSRPFAFGWYAFDEKGRMYRIREYYGCERDKPNTGLKMEPQAVANMVKQIEAEDDNLRGRYIYRVGDPAIWGTQGTESIGAIFERNRIYFEKADHNRINGKMQVHNRLAFDSEGRPMLYVFSTCKHFIRTVPNLVYDAANVEDIDTDGEDHIYDELRYACMTQPLKARKNEPPKLTLYDPLSTDDIRGYDPYEYYRYI